MRTEVSTARTTDDQVLARAHAELRGAIRHLRGVSTFLAEAPANADRLRSATHHAYRAAVLLEGSGRPWIRHVEHLVPEPPALPDALRTVAQVLAARRALDGLRVLAEAIAAEHASLPSVTTLPTLPPEELPRPLAEVGLWVSLATVGASITAILVGFVAAGLALAAAAMVVLALVGRALS